MKKDILYYKGFLESIEKKLGNERFMQNAKPEIIEIETKLNCKSNSTLISIFNILDDETYEEMRTLKK
jgi:valyl-tRNA synthetase